MFIANKGVGTTTVTAGLGVNIGSSADLILEQYRSALLLASSPSNFSLFLSALNPVEQEFTVTGGLIGFFSIIYLNSANTVVSSPTTTGKTVYIFADTGVAAGTTRSGTITPNFTGDLEYLVIAGGGGGGPSWNGGGGGGGAGGYRSSVVGELSGGGASAEAKLNVVFGAPLSVTVGAGGAGGTSSTSGTNSTLGSITSVGGGAGSPSVNASGTNGLSGGSGGGGGAGQNSGNVGSGGAGTANQGRGGGNSANNTTDSWSGGGGGGASTIGGTAIPSTGGNGGSGVSSSITGGTAVTRAGGGGGFGRFNAGVGGSGGGGSGGAGGDAPRSSGTANTGSGGGGGTGTSGLGGSGIVIIRFPSFSTSSTSSGSGNATTATNLAGGIASQIPYQSGASTTAFIANGTAGQFLQSNGTSAPSWTSGIVRMLSSTFTQIRSTYSGMNTYQSMLSTSVPIVAGNRYRVSANMNFQAGANMTTAVLAVGTVLDPVLPPQPLPTPTSPFALFYRNNIYPVQTNQMMNVSGFVILTGTQLGGTGTQTIYLNFLSNGTQGNNTTPDNVAAFPNSFTVELIG